MKVGEGKAYLSARPFLDLSTYRFVVQVVIGQDLGGA